MRLFINASTVLYSGGLAVALNIIYSLRDIKGLKIIVIAPPQNLYKNLLSENIEIKFVPKLLLIKIFRGFLDSIWLPVQLNVFNPDCVLSLGNLPVKTKYTQFFLQDNAFSVVRDFKQYNISFSDAFTHRLRNLILKRRLKHVDFIITQTQILREMTINKYSFPESKIIVLNPSKPEFQNNYSIDKRNLYFPKNIVNILLLTNYFSHKNIEILADVAYLIKMRGRPYKIWITIPSDYNRKTKKIEKIINDKVLNDQISFIRSFSLLETGNLIRHCNAIILPSLLESFSLVYCDAMYYGKPIFTSDLPFATESCEDAAFYFNPLSAENIFQILDTNLQDILKVEQKVQRGYEIMNRRKSWRYIYDIISANI